MKPLPPRADPGNFLVKTLEGKVRVNDMTTDHIFYSLRFTFNSLAPAELRVGPKKASRDTAKVRQWDRTYLRQATRALLYVLSQRVQRNELRPQLLEQYRQMAERSCRQPTIYLEVGLHPEETGTVPLRDGSTFDPSLHSQSPLDPNS